MPGKTIIDSWFSIQFCRSLRPFSQMKKQRPLTGYYFIWALKICRNCNKKAQFQSSFLFILQILFVSKKREGCVAAHFWMVKSKLDYLTKTRHFSPGDNPPFVMTLHISIFVLLLFRLEWQPARQFMRLQTRKEQVYFLIVVKMQKI